MKKIFKNKKGVSEIVGTILLLGMAIALFVGVHIVALNVIPFTPNIPSVRISGEIGYNETTGKNDTIYLIHNGGDALSLDTKVIFSNYKGELITEVTLKNNFKFKTEDNNPKGLWNIGEIIKYQNPNFDDKMIKMTIIDIETNSILKQDVFQG